VRTVRVWEGIEDGGERRDGTEDGRGGANGMRDWGPL
jgi:hypothetical protein